MSIAPLQGSRPANSEPKTEAERLLGVARQLEGVFVQQMLKAMRDTVPEDGMFRGGSGESMFTSMLDEHAATEAPKQWNDQLVRALVQQLGRVR